MFRLSTIPLFRTRSVKVCSRLCAAIVLLLFVSAEFRWDMLQAAVWTNMVVMDARETNARTVFQKGMEGKLTCENCVAVSAARVDSEQDKEMAAPPQDSVSPKAVFNPCRFSPHIPPPVLGDRRVWSPNPVSPVKPRPPVPPPRSSFS